MKTEHWVILCGAFGIIIWLLAWILWYQYDTHDKVTSLYEAIYDVQKLPDGDTIKLNK